MSDWKIVTLLDSKLVAANVKSLTFQVVPWQKHLPGQHYNIRLTTRNGYQAQRDYSIASAPEEQDIVEFGIELLADGEVSPYLFNLKKGEQIEIKGPIGGYFNWDISQSGPLVLIGGGAGMVPLMGMLRHHINNLDKDQGREILFLISARTKDHILYCDEIEEAVKKDPSIKIVYTLTRKIPNGWAGHKSRIDEAMLRETAGEFFNKHPMIYVCGPTPFVESVANDLLQMGLKLHEIKTERFGGNE